MENAMKKARKHRVSDLGAADRRFEVLCRDKGRLGGRRERHSQECVITNQQCACSCHKPRLLHRPCTHVIAACLEAGGLKPRMFVSNYFLKEVIWATWNNEIYGYRMLGNFINNPREHARYIPDPNPEMFQGVGRRKNRRIRNNMDQSEAGADVRLCSKCHETGHNYKNCPAMTYGWGTSQAGPSSTAPVPTSRTRGRRGRGNNDGLQ